MPSTRPSTAALLLIGAQSLLISQLPLLNVLGLEYAAATAPLIALLAGWPIVSGPADTLKPLRLVHVSAAGLWLAVVPLFFGLVAALFIRNCSLLGGLLDYVLVVPPAAVVGVGLASFVRGVSRRRPRTFFILVWFVVLAQIGVATLAGPQIYAFNVIVGFFPGFSYDESFGLPGSLVLFRIASLGVAVTLMSLGWMSERVRASRWSIWRTPAGAVTGLSAIFFIVLWWNADRLGWSSSLERIESELGGRRESEHFILLYPADQVTQEQAARLELLHEFAYERVRRTLRVWPQRKTVSIIYRDAAQKNMLNGGGRTNFAKPWLAQMHLLSADVRRTLRHELVHVMAADFGLPILGVGLNAGVIEGLAVAIDRVSNGESIHRAAAQIVSTGASIRVEDLFSTTGFFRSHSSVSYALAGSFSRYLIERFGIRAYKTFYRTGDSQRAFFHPLSDLVGGWRRRIDVIPLDRSDSLKASYYYRRPPLHARECLRVIGDLNAEARRQLAGSRDSLAAVAAERSWHMSPSTEAASLYVQALIRTSRPGLAAKFIDSLRSDASLWGSLQGLDLHAGDANWRTDSLVAAASAYQRLLEADLSLWWSEAAAIRWEGIVRWGWDRRAMDALIGHEPDSVRSALWKAVMTDRRYRAQPPMLRYALARTLSAENEPREVIALLDGSPKLGRPILDYAARRKLAAAFVVTQEWERAKAALWESLNYTDNEAEQIDVSETIAYCEWLKQRTPR